MVSIIGQNTFFFFLPLKSFSDLRGFSFEPKSKDVHRIIALTQATFVNKVNGDHMNHRTLFFILLFLIMQPISAIGQNPERQPEIQDPPDCITIDGRTYKMSPEFKIPPGIDIDSPVKLIFTNDTHELLSIERLIEDNTIGGSLEYHFGIVNAISKPGIDLSYRVYVDGVGYLFTSDTQIDEKAGFLEKYASVALVTRNGAAVSCRVISSNTAIPDKNIFWGEVEKIRKNTDTAEITINGITHLITNDTEAIGNVLTQGNWVFGYEVGDITRFISVITEKFPDPNETAPFQGIVSFISEPRDDGTFYITVADATMRVTPDAAASSGIAIGDYVSGYRFDGDALLINKHEPIMDQSGMDPFLYAGVISRIAVNAFQIDDVIIDYDDRTTINGRFEEGKYALESGTGDYAEMVFIIPDSYSDYSYHAVSGVITGIGAENSEGRRSIRLDEDIFYLTRDSISGKNLSYDEIGTALYRGTRQISIMDVLEKPVDRGVRFSGRISASVINGSESPATITVGGAVYTVPLTAGLSGFSDLSRLHTGARVEGYAYDNEVIAVRLIKGAGLLGILNPPWLEYAAAGGTAVLLFVWIIMRASANRSTWHTGAFDIGSGDMIILDEGNGQVNSYTIDRKLFDFLTALDEKTVSVKVRKGRIIEIR